MKASDHYKIQWLSFSELSRDMLYSILKLRSDVFVVEQVCAYPDLDNKDQNALHGIMETDQEIIAYIRIYKVDNFNWTFGRVIVALSYRNLKLGRYFINKAMQKINEIDPKASIIIGAQARLEKYYQQFGFVSCSEPYDDFGILHIDMKYTP
ncbi:GNAT family N-acetyltransferase [Thiotrichales bacterium 19S11-10]|nr:GNAT family N-acetyltransferase [Thiotrichales bacterium 19S11-10]